MLKKNVFTVLFFIILHSLSLYACAGDTDKHKKYTYLFVHGVTGGGWDWKGIDDRLTADGHTAFRVTLTGLGERAHLAHADINLTTHINDVINTIHFENLVDVVLVGHSYGGMVITGVMDKIPERIGHVIFLDASVPNDGMSANDLSGPLPKNFAVKNGLVHFPWIDNTQPYPRDVPHPLKTLTEPVSYKNPKAKQLPVTYLAFVSPKYFDARLKHDRSLQHAKARGWDIQTLDSDHNAHRSHPTELVALLKLIPTF